MKKTSDLMDEYRTVQRFHDVLQADPPLPEQIDNDSRVATFVEYYTRAGLSRSDTGEFSNMMNWIKENSSQRYRASARARQKTREQNWLQRVQ